MVDDDPGLQVNLYCFFCLLTYNRAFGEQLYDAYPVFGPPLEIRYPLLTFSSGYIWERHVCWYNIQVKENLTLGTFEYQMQALTGFIIILG